mmetsp:Transcript_28190/g.51558  ORF Transcript_28190/g.51558 Transcript_28190/m.51558 type:complete len:96 (+) Transcript_28190:165-452(+)
MDPIHHLALRIVERTARLSTCNAALQSVRPDFGERQQAQRGSACHLFTVHAAFRPCADCRHLYGWMRPCTPSLREVDKTAPLEPSRQSRSPNSGH